MLLSTLIVERAIPHQHAEKEGLLIVDFSYEDQHEEQNDMDHHEEAEEKLHSSYFLSTFVYGFEVQTIVVLYIIKQFLLLPVVEAQVFEYNILPKVLNSI